MKKVAVIFDFDATLVDSEDNYYLADKILVENLSGKQNFTTINNDIINAYVNEFYLKTKNSYICKNKITFEKKDKIEFIGLDGKEVITRIKNKFALPGDIPQLLAEKNRLYITIALQHTIAYPKMLTLVQKLHEAKIKLAVASGTYHDNLVKLLEITNLLQYFDEILSGDDVKIGKPAPQIFLTAAQKLNCQPKNCFVVEDSLHGVQAALAAKMHLIAVPYLLQDKYNEAFYQADYLATNGMQNFEPEKAFTLINEIKNE